MITFAEKKPAKSVQFNCRLPRDIQKMIEDGCRETGLSQSKFLTLCVLKQSNEIPGLVRGLQRAVWEVLSKDTVNGTLK
jgi:hypothetical protein